MWSWACCSAYLRQVAWRLKSDTPTRLLMTLAPSTNPTSRSTSTAPWVFPRTRPCWPPLWPKWALFRLASMPTWCRSVKRGSLFGFEWVAMATIANLLYDGFDACLLCGLCCCEKTEKQFIVVTRQLWNKLNQTENGIVWTSNRPWNLALTVTLLLLLLAQLCKMVKISPCSVINCYPDPGFCSKLTPRCCQPVVGLGLGWPWGKTKMGPFDDVTMISQPW